MLHSERDFSVELPSGAGPTTADHSDHTPIPLGDEERPAHFGPLRTPIARLTRLFPAANVEVWAKLDHLQPAGSMKERSAHYLLEDLQRRGCAGPGATLVASTSGNFGIALARQAAIRGMHLVAVVDVTANRAALRAMAAFGAEIDVVEVGPEGNRLAARLARVSALAEQIPEAVVADQYTSLEAPRAHAETTMPEIVEQLGAAPTHLYVATSTAGTLVGCQDAIEQHRWGTQVVAVDAQGSVLFGGAEGQRHLPGLGAGVESDHARRAHPDAVRQIREIEMIRGARRLARAEGLLAGASTGAVVAAIAHDVESLPPGSVIAMLVHDSGVGYLDTVYDDEWVARTYGQTALAEVA